MNLRLLAMALCAVAISVPASAADARPRDARARIGHARYSRPEDGLAGAVGRRRKGPSLAQHHRAPDRGAGRLGARRRAGSRRRIRPGAASPSGSRPTARCTGRWRKIWSRPMATAPTATTTNTSTTARPIHQVIGSNSIGVEFAGNYPDVTAARHRGAGRGVADPGEGAAGALRHSARSRLCPQLDRLQGRALLRRLRAGDAGAGVGRVTGSLRPAAPSSGRCAMISRAAVGAAVAPAWASPRRCSAGRNNRWNTMSFGSVTVKLLRRRQTPCSRRRTGR